MIPVVKESAEAPGVAGKAGGAGVTIFMPGKVSVRDRPQLSY